MVKILTWNVNGIRALPDDLRSTLNTLDADIICFQETKITRDQLDLQVAVVEGYNAYYSFSRKRSGYSGVAIFCRQPLVPVAASEGLSCLNSTAADRIGNFMAPDDLAYDRISELDSEGRTVMVQFKTKCCNESEHKLTVISVYCPRADPDNPARTEFKMDFHRLLQHRAEQLAQEGHVVVAGDLNISHRLIDHCDSEDPKSSYSGVLHEEFIAKPARQWIDHFLTATQRDPELENFREENEDDLGIREDTGGIFADNFRVKHPDRADAFTCWCSKTGARQTNFGNRIDYILSDTALTEHCLIASDIHPDVMGSDHCPVSADFALEILPAPKCPSLCARFLPGFQGQQKISDFFLKRPASQSASCAPPVKRKASQSRLDLFVGKKPRSEENRKEPQEVEVIRKESGTRNAAANAWNQLLSGPGKAPNCRGHGEPCVLRTVKKESLNKGRQFWVCAHPEGPPSNPNSRCDHFVWIERKKK